MNNPEIMLLGRPDSGKTHFAGQFYGRIKNSNGLLKIRQEEGIPPNLTIFEDVLRSLENGHTAQKTAPSAWDEVVLPLINTTGKSADIRWPDYGGEQLEDVFKNRQVQNAWLNRLTQSTGWIVLIRLDSELAYENRLQSLQSHPSQQKSSVPEATSKKLLEWDSNAKWIEILQILLSVSNHSTSTRIEKPKLVVLLSCYDIHIDKQKIEQISPREKLKAKLPLLDAFIHNNWTNEAVSIWGLSALGKNLDKEIQDNSFLDEGPENQGWIIKPEGGEKVADLTLPLAWFLNLL